MTRGVDSLEIPYKVVASANVANAAYLTDILTLRASSGNTDASVARKGTVTLNDQKYPVKRSDHPESNTDLVVSIKLKGKAFIENVFKEKQEIDVFKTVTVIIEPNNDDPAIRATAKTTPNSVKYNNSDVRVKLDVTGELYNYDNASNVQEWKFYAKEKDDTTNATLQSKTISGNVLSQKTSFNFTIPKSKLTGSNYTQVYTVTAVAVFKKAVAGKTSLQAPAEAATYVYKEATPPPPKEPDPNIPPVAVIGGPTEVDAGSQFTLDGSSSYDPDGTIIDYKWGRPSGCGNSEDKRELQKFVCSYPGTYTFGLTVIDNKGAASRDTYHTVVVKAPLPKAFIKVDGTLKQNRKVVINGSKSYEPPGYPINKYEWDITAVSGGTQADVKFVGSVNDVSKDVLLKQEGTYRVKLTVWNQWGSDTAERVITIKPDLPPIMESSSITPVYRQSYYENKALIELEDFSYSGDGDYINARTVAVAFDANNDGTCANDAYTTLSSTAGKRYAYFASQVGNYCFKISATETFGEPTIPQFITPADYRSGVSEVKVNVDNYAPSTSFGILRKKFVDINFNLGESNYASLDELKTKVNTLVLPELAANGIDAKITYGDARPAASKLFYYYTIKNNEYYTIKPYIYNPDTGITKEIDQRHASGVVMPDDTIIYLDATGTLQKYDVATGTNTKFYTPPEHYISSFAINKLGNVFYTSMWVVGHSGYMQVGVFMYDPVTRITKQIHQSNANGNGLYGYSNLQANFNGNVSVQYADSGSIWYKTHANFSPTGTFLGDSDNYPNGIFGTDGYLYGSGGVYGKFNDTYSGTVLNVTSSRSKPYMYYNASWKPFSWDTRTASDSGLMRLDLTTRAEEQIDPSYSQIAGMTYDEKLYYRMNNKMYVYDPDKNSKEFVFNTSTDSDIGYAPLNLLPTTDVVNMPPSDKNLKSLTWRDPTNKFFVDITNKNRADMSSPQTQSSMLKELLVNDVSYNLLGSTANEAQTNALIALNNGKGKYYDNSDPDAALTNFTNDLITRVNQDAVLDHYLLLGESLDYMTSYLDPEGDPERDARWRFDHDPSVFENNQGSIDNNGGFIPGAIITPPKVGKYEVQYQAQDNPTTNPNYFSYRKWSEGPGDTLTFYVHRAPFALFTASANLISNQYHVAIREYSYDLDHQTATGKGIAQKVWRWKNIKDAGWTLGLPPTILGENEQYVVSLKVKDVEGAWSDENVQIIGSTGNLPPVALFTAEPARISQADNLTITDLSYDPNNDPIVERKWDATKDGVQIYAGATPPTANQLKSGATAKGKLAIGTYTLSLQVRDEPPVGVSMWSNIYKQDIRILNVPPEAIMQIPNGTKDNPTVFSSKRPVFRWVQTDADPGTVFKKYQIQIINEYNSNFIADSGELNQNTSATTATWTMTTDLPTGKKMQIRVRVNDGIEWSNWSPRTWFMINSPPIADFDWSPKPLWEGDLISLINQSTDPDGDILAYRWDITGPNGYMRTSTDIHPTLPDTANRPGIYNVTLTAKDPSGESATMTKPIVVGELILNGRVKHTPQWEENRLNWNSKNPKKTRAENVFWAGEAFVLEATVTDTGTSETHALSVHAMASIELQKSLMETAPRSELWTAMLLQGDTNISFEDLPNGPYVFVFTVNYSNGVTKTSAVPIEIRNTVDEYVQVHRIQ
nr:PKD domain-containing protein [Cohnella mopanensis]